jgi:hypothetical protein
MEQEGHRKIQVFFYLGWLGKPFRKTWKSQLEPVVLSSFQQDKVDSFGRGQKKRSGKF